MKRSPELRDLSVQHRDGLIAARHLRRGAAGEVPLEEAVTRFLAAWRDGIQPHFRMEEEVLLPGLAPELPPDDARIVRTLTEHVALRRSVHDLMQAEGSERQRVAGEIGQALDEHIRFEERVLFPTVESRLDATRLAELGRELRQQAPLSCPMDSEVRAAHTPNS